MGWVTALALIVATTGACSGTAADPPRNPSGGSGGTPSGGGGGKPNGGGTHAGGQGGTAAAASAGTDSGGAGAGGSTGGMGAAPAVFDSSDLQLNDVSVLFPLPSSAAEQSDGLLAMTAKGARGELLPKRMFEELPSIFGSVASDLIGATNSASYDNLRVVAMRIDPCFAELEPPASGQGCRNQVRLVVQETEVGSAFDSGLHLFYAVSREEVLELVRAIGGLRQKLAVSRALGKLQPHPLMVEQGLAGEMASGVRAAILAHAGSENLVRITRMTQNNGPFWDFSGFEVESGKLVPMHIPTLPADGDAKQTIERNFGAFQGLEANPPSGSTDEITLLSRPTEASALSESERAAKLTSLLRVENPGAHSPDTIDCASCHAATPIKKLVVEPHGWSTAGLPAFEPNAARFDREALEPSYDGDTTPIMNVHAFSYFGAGLGISQRVVNESAAIVDYLSKQDFGAVE